jgi:hypothetical protein
LAPESSAGEYNDIAFKDFAAVSISSKRNLRNFSWLKLQFRGDRVVNNGGRCDGSRWRVMVNDHASSSAFSAGPTRNYRPPRKIAGMQGRDDCRLARPIMPIDVEYGSARRWQANRPWNDQNLGRLVLGNCCADDTENQNRDHRAHRPNESKISVSLPGARPNWGVNV